MPKEKRRSERRPFTYPCWLESGRVQQCRLLDISKGGARVAVRYPSQIQDTVILYLTHNKATGRHCRVAWRFGTEIGLEFLRSFSSFEFKPKVVVEV
jgi:hypothetical protein